MIMKQRRSEVRERITSENRGICRERVDVVWEDMQREGEGSVKKRDVSADFLSTFRFKRMCVWREGGEGEEEKTRTKSGQRGTRERRLCCAL